jgi:hypothetical protein
MRPSNYSKLANENLMTRDIYALYSLKINFENLFSYFSKSLVSEWPWVGEKFTPLWLGVVHLKAEVRVLIPEGKIVIFDDLSFMPLCVPRGDSAFKRNVYQNASWVVKAAGM